MAIPVRLEDVIDALEMPENWEAFLDPDSGEIITVTDEERDYLEEEDLDPADLPEWQRASLEQARRATESDRMLRLPDRFEVHEWEIMRQFAQSWPAPISTQLLASIHGSGAFRKFRSGLDRLGLRDEWFAFRDETLQRIATDWLEVHGIAFVKGTPPKSRSGETERVDS
jgi:hypothetical protein